MTTQTVATEKNEKILNGVNVTKLIENIRAIQSDPGLADFKFRAKNAWLDGALNRTTVDGFYGVRQEIAHPKPFAMDADEPAVLLGEHRGPNPVEYVLTALSACMTTTLAYHAAAQGIEVEAVESDYEGDIDLHGFLDLDPNVRKGYEEIRVRFKVKSDADKEKLEELVKKSPVFDIVTNPTPVKVEVEKV